MADGKSVDENELIDLYFVTHHNYIFQGRVTRKWASDTMRSWYKNREALRDAKCPEDIKDESRRWLQHGTIAHNVATGGGSDGGSICVTAVAWEHVIGMYTRTLEPSVQEQSADALKRLAAAAEKDIKSREAGDDWKQGGEDES